MDRRLASGARKAASALRQFCAPGLTLEVGNLRKGAAVAGVIAAAAGAYGLAQREGQSLLGYGGMVGEVQAKVDEAVGKGRVLVLNRILPTRFEAIRMNLRLREAGATERVRDADLVHDTDGEGAFARGDMGLLSRPGGVCVLVGPPPGRTPRDFFSGIVEGLGAVEVGDVTPADSNFFSFMHEAGHCLLGSSEAEADAFAALMLVRERDTKDFLPRWAALRELAEWEGTPTDDHVTSATVRAAMRFAAEPGARERLRAMSWGEIGRLARDLARAQPTGVEAGLRQAVREGLWTLRKGGEARQAMGARSLAVPYAEWQATSPIPEVERIRGLRAFLYGYGPAPDGDFAFDPARSLEVMRGLAPSGDSAALILAGYEEALGGAPAPALSVLSSGEVDAAASRTMAEAEPEMAGTGLRR